MHACAYLHIFNIYILQILRIYKNVLKMFVIPHAMCAMCAMCNVQCQKVSLYLLYLTLNSTYK